VTTRLDRLRVLNKHLLNPAMLHLAGRKHWYAGVIRHTGRRSGKTYSTPVVADRVADGFIVPLPYGTHVDWLRNVLAADNATIEVSGQTYEVVHPRIINAVEAAPQLPSGHRRTFQRFGIANYLTVELAPRSR
jgi:deazaflavin-dependent oxidoreductase (nitroreductase family)